MKNFLFIVLFSFLPFCLVSQNQEKSHSVLLKNLQGTYEGKIKKGLAHGKGIAKGIDTYKGNFYKGLPHGEGTYTWKNGDYYVGSWYKGKRSGIGKLVSMTDSTKTLVLDGYWENDKYIDKTKPIAFKYRLLSGQQVRVKYLSLNREGGNVDILIRKYGNLLSENVLVDYRFISNTATAQLSGTDLEFIIKDATFPFKAELWFTILETNIYNNETEIRYGIEIEVFQKGDGIINIDL